MNTYGWTIEKVTRIHQAGMKMTTLIASFSCLLLLCWPYVSIQANPSPSKDMVIARLLELEITLNKELGVNTKEASEEIERIFDGLDRAKDPEAWVLALSLLADNQRQEKFNGNWDSLAETAIASGYIEGAVRLLWIEMDRFGETASRQQALRIFDRVKALSCQDEQHKLLCARNWILVADYFYAITDLPEGLEAIKNALAILDEIPGVQPFYAFDARTSLANLLFAQGKIDNAIKISKENLKSALENDDMKYAALIASSIANFMLSLEPLDKVEIGNYNNQALDLAIKLNDVERIAYIHYGKGKLQLMERDFSNAIESFQHSYELYVSLDLKIYAILCRIYEAKAWLGTKNSLKAKKALKEAESMMPADFNHGKLLLLETFHDLALSEQNFKQAHDYLKDYLDAWKIQKEKEEKKNLQNMTSSLELKIQEQQNKALESELNNQKKIRILITTLASSLMGLTSLVMVFMSIALKKSKLVKKSQERMKLVLDHIEEGILTIGRNFRVESDFSPYLGKILWTHDKHDNMLKVLMKNAQWNAEQCDMINSSITAVLDEDPIAWDLNSEHFPLEAEVDDGTKQLALEWSPIIKSNRTQKILVTIRDVTLRKDLQLKIISAQQKMSRLGSILDQVLKLDRLSAGAFLRETSDLQDVAKAEIEHTHTLKRRLHTLKGIARTLGFAELSQMIHSTEDLLGDQPKLRENWPHISLGLVQVHELIVTYREIMEKTFHAQGSPGQLSLCEMVALHLPALQAASQNANLRLGRVEVMDEFLVWTHELAQFVQAVLTHSLTNSLDHGFVLPLQKGRKIDRLPVFQVEATRKDNTLRIAIRDNGVGLDLLSLQALAEKRGLQMQTDEQLYDLVFADGATTAANLTERSGRGIGLAAVRELCTAWQGLVRMQPRNDGPGSSLEIAIPCPG